ncbi:MAG: outer membrane protein assembly factor [Gammaproteobacteria bacterium]|nr:outer membrane protein assembly factor [Gammaproteobacteria bacterium]
MLPLLRTTFFAWGLLIAPLAAAQSIVEETGDQTPRRLPVLVPYAFSSDSTDWAVGVAAGRGRLLGQKQARALVTVFASENDSYAAHLLVSDLQLPSERWFVDFQLSLSKLGNRHIYVDGNLDFPEETAGSNESSKDNFLSGDGTDNQIGARFQYVLPIGAGSAGPIHRYQVRDGLLQSGASGGGPWNPLRSGRTIFSIKPFYRREKLDGAEAGEQVDFKTNGVRLDLEYDNRDFDRNPSRGSHTRVSATSDFGWFDSSDSWTFLDGEFSGFYSLGESDGFRQRVLAVNAWTGYSPSWEESQTPAGAVIRNRPPPFEGATLGGLERMRAYTRHRFNDRAVLYYAAELRLIPRNNFWRDLPLLNRLDIKWWQLVGFIEAGRVGPDWNLKDLHSDLKVDAGVGLRWMVRNSVIRVDLGFSDEETKVTAMARHAF